MVKRKRSVFGPKPSLQFPQKVREAAEVLKRIYFCERRRMKMLQELSHEVDIARTRRGAAKDPSELLDNKFYREPQYTYEQTDIESKLPEDCSQWNHTRWHELAQRVLDKGLDPKVYIRSQFLLLTPLDEIPKLSSLTTAWRMNAVGQIRETFISQQRHFFTFQVQKATAEIRLLQVPGQDNNGLSPGDATLHVLWDESNALTPLFRYCIAMAEQKSDPAFGRLAAQLRDPAALQLVRDKEAYLEAWTKDWIPQELQDAAEEIYHQIYQGD